MIIRTLSLIALALLTVATGARGQGLAANPVVTETEEDQLAREVDDPTAILAQLKFQDLYTPSNFQTPAQTNQVDLKVVLPIESFSFFPFKQVIRPTLKVQTLAISQTRWPAPLKCPRFEVASVTQRRRTNER